MKKYHDRKYFYNPEYGYEKHYTGPHEIMYAIGRIIGLILMFGGGILIGQILRGVVMAFLYGPPA